MLQSGSGDLFNFLMTTLFNSVKMMQLGSREGDLGAHQEADRHRIFTTNSLDMHFGELSRQN